MCDVITLTYTWNSNGSMLNDTISQKCQIYPNDITMYTGYEQKMTSTIQYVQSDVYIQSKECVQCQPFTKNFFNFFFAVWFCDFFPCVCKSIKLNSQFNWIALIWFQIEYNSLCRHICNGISWWSNDSRYRRCWFWTSSTSRCTPSNQVNILRQTEVITSQLKSSIIKSIKFSAFKNDLYWNG